MLEIYEKRKTLRLMQGKGVVVMQSPVEVMKSAVGVHQNSLVEHQTIMINHLMHELSEIQELLRKIHRASKRNNSEFAEEEISSGTEV